ncbi:hypothetical protein LTR53_016704 [Teratosphaeriaceae sp. CCFEE 6253]|nr:hypothetical protein LTR53_016704 [Teratosphaeriaceae sp. CCFEE 6253]
MLVRQVEGSWQFTSAIAAAILAIASVNVLAAPVPQLAGEGTISYPLLLGVNTADDLIGAAANSLLSGTDNAVGYGTENAEDKLAGNVATVKAAIPAAKRQLASEGAAADSLLSGTDNAVGYGVENAEDKIAGDVATTKAALPAVAAKRQLDNISNGAQAISSAAGTGDSTKDQTDALDSIDGTLTSGAANLGADTATAEVATAEAAGNAVPKSRRQLDKISNGAQAISNAAGTGAATTDQTDALDSIDGTLTSGAANLGADTANVEVATAEAAGNAVPKL